MKHLYTDDYEVLTKEGQEISAEFNKALRPIVEKYMNLGYDSHDIQMIVINDVTYLGSIHRVKKTSKMLQEERCKAQRLAELSSPRPCANPGYNPLDE